MNKKLLLLFLVITSLATFARKPAVMPVRGISIDDYKSVKMKDAKGFDFKNNKPASASPVIAKKNEAPEKFNNLWFILFFALPLGLWFAIMKNLEQPLSPEEDPASVAGQEGSNEYHDDPNNHKDKAS